MTRPSLGAVAAGFDATMVMRRPRQEIGETNPAADDRSSATRDRRRVGPFLIDRPTRLAIADRAGPFPIDR